MALRHRKGQICLTKGHSDNQKGNMVVEYPLHQKLFLTLFIQIKKKNFFQKGLFLKMPSIPGQFIFLK